MQDLVNKIQSPKVYFPLILLLIIGISSLFSSNQFYQHVIFLSIFYAAVGSCWNILGGMAKQFSFGHAAFMGISGYASAYLFLELGLSPWIGMFIGAILAVIIGTLMFYPSFKLSGFYFAIATLAFLEIVRSVVTYWRVQAGGIDTYIPFVPSLGNMIFQSKASYIMLALIFLIIMLLVEYFITRSKFGYYLRAVGENEDAAEMLGVQGSKIKYYAFLISAFCVAIGGAIYVQYFLFVTPSMVFNVNLSLQLALVCIIGGISTLAGPIIGAFLLVILDTVLRAWIGSSLGEIGFIIYGIMLIVVVLYAPNGILPWISRKLEFLWNILPDKSFKPDYKSSEIIEPVLRKSNKVSKGEVLLDVKNIKKHFGSLKAIDGVDFQVYNGEILGLIGPNGSGKTTMYNMLTGFLKPTEGVITFKGENVTGLNKPSNYAQKGIARTFQIVKPFKGTTILENVMVGALLKRDMKSAREFSLGIIKSTGLFNYKDVNAGNLPIAICKRLELAKALATEPDILMLDETMAGLTSTEKLEIANLLKSLHKKYGLTIIIIEHDMKSIMQLCDRIVVMNYGKKIGDGTPAEISRNSEVITAYLGQEVQAYAEG